MYLIIQTGDPVPPAMNQFGRFSDWFIQGLSLKPNTESLVIDVHKEQKLPAVAQTAEKLTGIIITGSPAMVTDKDEWLTYTQKWLNQVMTFNIPTLGICFGHQLLADLLGGQVAYNSKGRNLGLSEFNLSTNANNDPLLKPISQHTSIPTFASHLQHVKTLPKSATLLGSCELDKNHAFRAEEVLWGLQFHPEWDIEITQTYIQARSDALVKEGVNPDERVQQLQSCDQSYSLLAQFADFAQNHRS